MTTLAIIGGGIAGRSLLYTLTKSDIPFEKIYLFYSDSFAPPCSLSSTAIVAARGVSSGLSPLGDLLKESFENFVRHFEEDRPSGVMKVSQYTGAVFKLDQFKKRYPGGEEASRAGEIPLKSSMYIAHEEAYMIDPVTYLSWLTSQSSSLPVEEIKDFVIGIEQKQKVHLQTQNGRELEVDKLVLCTGASSRSWKELLPSPKLSSSRPVQGAYLEFHDVNLAWDSISLTLEGDNFIYDKTRQRLLIGSTTEEHGLLLADEAQLRSIYLRLQEKIDFRFPRYEEALMRVGLREKASKREPYLLNQGHLFAVGGLYKNGYSLASTLAQKLIKKLKSS